LLNITDDLKNKEFKFHYLNENSRIIPEKIRSLADEMNIPVVRTTKDELNRLLKDDRPHQVRLKINTYLYLYSYLFTHVHMYSFVWVKAFHLMFKTFSGRDFKGFKT